MDPYYFILFFNFGTILTSAEFQRSNYDNDFDGDGSYVSMTSESLMDYFESLPKALIKRLLDGDELSDFIDTYQDQVFNNKIVTGSRNFIDTTSSTSLSTR